MTLEEFVSAHRIVQRGKAILDGTNPIYVPREVIILHYLNKEGGAPSITTIAKALVVHNSNLSAILADMLKSNLITIKEGSRRTRRSISLTAEGLAALDDITLRLADGDN